MYELIIFYIISTQWSIDVNQLQQSYHNEALCKIGQIEITNKLKNLSPEIKIESTCSFIKT
jgi:hypothetical protein